jgi:hypothetical protein
VVCDGLLTALRLSGWEFSLDFLIPLLSMAIEIVCASLLVIHIRRLTLPLQLLATRQLGG